MNDIAINRHRGNPQSKDANLRVEASKSVMRKRIVEKITKYGSSHLKELCRIFDKHPNEISGRLTELKADGVIEEKKDHNNNTVRKEHCAVLQLKSNQTSLFE